MRTTAASKMEKLAPRWKITLQTAMLLLLMANSASSSVQRPTIFRDFAQDEQQQQPAIAQSASPHQPVHTQADGAPSTKISPLKSRFCQHQSQALGLQSMRIEHAAISASSYSNAQVAPHLARLNLELVGGAWCPGKPISTANFGKEWVQVRLNRSFVVTAIETQGRHQGGSGREWAPNYQVEYSRNSGRTWHKWKDPRGNSVLRGNEDPNTPVRNELWPPIVGANVIRILPYSQHLRTVCLRFELHGCPYDEGAPVVYESPDGVVEPRWGNLMDYTYDGLRQNGRLSGGLGQLVDGVKGPDNFSHNTGFEWVGWKSMNGDLEIEFTFRTVRNFTGALFHSNNLFSAGVEVFSGVDVHYGLDVSLGSEPLRELLRSQRQGLIRQDLSAVNSEEATVNTQETLWSPDVLSIEYEPDKRAENSRPVTVHLKQRLANKLRFVLKFASKWILVSEVEFLSHPVELLSPLHLAQESTSPTDHNQVAQLINSLAPAKTYDEYVAILREHQLRKKANAYLESIITSSSSPSNDEPSTLGTQFFGSQTQTQTQNPPNQLQDSASNSWPPLDPNKPATNPLLQPNLFLSGGGGAFFPPSVPLPPPGEPSSNLAPASRDPFEASENRQRHLGVATMIGFVLVGLLIVAGALFAISSYRLRAQGPKLGQLPRHLGSDLGAHNHKSGLHSFISSVFAGSNPPEHQHHQQQPPTDHLYNAIFATNERRHLEHHQRQTLKRLASLQKSQHHNQLLVSVKDSSPSSGSKTLFGSSRNQNKQAVSTQLIVGLNQANPLAQQQIYNTNNCQSNQTYATNYSTSMSMASSSTTTGAHHHSQDYAGGADYAIPDVQAPILPQHYHLNHAFTPTTTTSNHHLFGAGKQVRTSTNPLMPTMPIRSQHLEHNYELVQQQQEQQLHRPPTNHQRVNSSGPITTSSCPFAAVVGASTMVSANLATLRRPPPNPPVEECSPGSQSTSSAATATTSANSSTNLPSDLYYYTAHQAERK